MRPFAHQPGAATFSESTGQPEQSKLHKVVSAGLQQQNLRTRTYVGPADSAVQLGPEQLDLGPVVNLGRGRTSSSRTPPQREAEAELGL